MNILVASPHVTVASCLDYYAIRMVCGDKLHVCSGNHHLWQLLQPATARVLSENSRRKHAMQTVICTTWPMAVALQVAKAEHQMPTKSVHGESCILCHSGIERAV